MLACAPAEARTLVLAFKTSEIFENLRGLTGLCHALIEPGLWI